MKIYMIDDNADKQAWFMVMLAKANEVLRNKGDAELTSGFGTDPARSAALSITADGLWEAVHDSDAAYCVDCELLTTFDNRYGLWRRLKDCREGSWEHEAAMDHPRAGGERPDASLSKIAEKYPDALTVLLALKRRQARALGVSRIWNHPEILNLSARNLLDVPTVPFPEGRPTVDMSAGATDVGAWATQILALIDPLGSLQRKIREWFLDDSIRPGNLPHNPPSAESLDNHIACIRSLFANCPDTWWASHRKTESLHSGIKSALAVLTVNSNLPISLGGAYCIFLLALRDKAPGRLAEFFVEDWECFQSRSGEIPFVGQQRKDHAERSFKALYHLFSAIIHLKEKDRDRNPIFGLHGRIRKPTEERPSFGIKLKWRDEDITRLGEQIADLTTDCLERDSSLPPGKTAGAFLRFALASQVRFRGFGVSGGVYLDHREPRWLNVGLADR